MERCRSGRTGRSRKPLSLLRGTEGSNPSLSAIALNFAVPAIQWDGGTAQLGLAAVVMAPCRRSGGFDTIYAAKVFPFGSHAAGCSPPHSPHLAPWRRG